jgi:spermidine synthase
MRRTLALALGLIGFTSLIGQVMLLREALIAFYGNELSWGAILAIWLIWGATGSWLLGRYTDRIKRRASLFIFLLLLAPLILLGEIILLRIIKNLLGISYGEVIGFFPALLWSFLLLAPLCLVQGFQFTSGCKLYSLADSETTSSRSRLAPLIGQAYVCESLGAISGGLLYNYYLLLHINPIRIASLIGILNSLIALILLRKIRGSSKLLISSALILLGLNIYTTGFYGDIVQSYFIRWQWRGYNLVEAADSIYGNLVVTRSKDQYSFYENGLLMYTTGDFFYNETITHLPLLLHPAPRRVLLIGGGVSGALTEILKHPVGEVNYVELDPLLIKLGSRYSYPPDREAIDDPRVNIRYGDGRLFVKQSEKKYDLIILNLPDPFTAQLNRFYTLEFFLEIRRILRRGGIFSLGLPSSEEYIGPEMKNLNGSIYKTFKRAFPDCMIVPTYTVLFLGSDEAGVLSYDPEVLLDRFQKRAFRTRVLDPFYLKYMLFPYRISYTLDRLEDNKELPLNRDFHPIAIYYDIALWNISYYPHLKKLFHFPYRLSLSYLIPLPLLALLFVLIARRKTHPYSARPFVPLVIFTTGFTEMLLEVVLLFSFQVLYGYVYSKVAIIVTSFMIGLALGSWNMNRWITSPAGRGETRDIRMLVKIQIAIILYSLVVPLICASISYITAKAFLFLAIELGFPLLTIIIGFLGGSEFPLANKIYLRDPELVGHTAGTMYGSDLVGSCLGAISAGALLIPILGIFSTCATAAMLSLTTLILILGR